MKAQPRLVSFIGGNSGLWSVERIVPVAGPPLAPVSRVAVVEEGEPGLRLGSREWILSGLIQGDHYVTSRERESLDAVSPLLGRHDSTSAALIPIKKSPAWWALPIAERRAIFEERSHHVAQSLSYLPRIARRLHHGRDLGEPFDFLTWFEFAPADKMAFDELVGMLRATEEWTYVDREIDIRLRRDGHL